MGDRSRFAHVEPTANLATEPTPYATNPQPTSPAGQMRHRHPFPTSLSPCYDPIRTESK